MHFAKKGKCVVFAGCFTALAEQKLDFNFEFSLFTNKSRSWEEKLCLEFGLVAPAWPNTFRTLFFRLGYFFLSFLKSVVLRIVYETITWTGSKISKHVVVRGTTQSFVKSVIVPEQWKWIWRRKKRTHSVPTHMIIQKLGVVKKGLQNTK